MKNLTLLILLFVIPFFGYTQDKKHQLSGTIFYVSYHQGGMKNPYEPIPSPKERVKLYVVELTENEIPKQVGEVTSDGSGDFSIKLPKGKYGFVLKEDLDSLIIGQFLPKGWSRGDAMNSSNSSWSISGGQPIQITGKDISGVVITNTKASICGLCP